METATSGTYVGEDYVLDWKCVPAEQLKDKIGPRSPPEADAVRNHKGSINALRLTDIIGNLKRIAMDCGVDIEINRETHLLWQNVYWKATSKEEYRVRAFGSSVDGWIYQFNDMLRKGR